MASSSFDIVSEFDRQELVNALEQVRREIDASVRAAYRALANGTERLEAARFGVDAAREHPSDILDYFLPKEEILSRGLMDALEQNYLDKHDAVNRTADALVKAGIGVACAWNLHK